VLVVVDQLRGDYLDRYAAFLGDDGFRRLQREGAQATDCTYGHAVTETGPGHATIATGTHPGTNGIIANDWLDPATRQSVYCVGTADGVSPAHLRGETLADRLVRATDGRGVVLSLAMKDRSAVLLAGRLADGAYWSEVAHGNLITSDFYRLPRPPARRAQDCAAFVDRLNATGPDRPVDRWRGHTWTRLVDPESATGKKLYARLAADDYAGEKPPGGWTRHFPHVLDKGPLYYGRLTVSPFGHTFLLEAARRAIDELALGKDDDADLLLVGLSSLDYVGHYFGPDSHEVADTMLRLDRDLAAFFQSLDQRVGKGRWTVALTADHGVAPIPAWGREKLGWPSLPAVDDLADGEAGGLLVRLSRFLHTTWADRLANLKPAAPVGEGLARSVRFSLFSREDGQIYFKHTVLKERGIDPAEAARTTVDWLRRQPEVDCALTRADVLEGPLPDHPSAPFLRRSFDPERSGDVLLSLVPSLYPGAASVLAATHGSPHRHDRHVPLMLMGFGVKRGFHLARPCGVVDLAPTLARLLGIEAPVPGEGSALTELLGS
jgi:arylsulfatase A-like enzyme